MPNLLKSLPREILEKEDTQFIYNVLNPLLFEKVRDIHKDIRRTYTVSELLEKDINLSGQFDSNFIFPYNINSREFHVYMDDGQEKIKLERYSNSTLVQDLDDLIDYIFFYFGESGYGFIQQIIEKYYTIKNEYEKNKRLYETNLEKYTFAVDVKKKKVYKHTYERFKVLFEEYSNLKMEFDLLMTEMSKHEDYSVEQIIDNFAKVLGSHLNIKTFDNDIVFESSKLFKYLTEHISYESTVYKKVFSGKEIISITAYSPDNIFELLSIFAMEISSVKFKYDTYLKMLIDNGYNGYTLERSEHRKLKNSVYKNVKVDLESNNLTYFLNEEKNELEIYLYFARTFKIDESTFKLNINSRNINASIVSLNGTYSYGYTMFNYMDDEVKYYKITVHNYLIKDLDGEYLNYNIENIDLEFTAVDTVIETITESSSPIIETTSFLDNFTIYKKNDVGFFEEFKIPFKIKIDIEEKEERYIRIYEFQGIDIPSHELLLSQEEILISYYTYDYVYEPKIYVDFFKHLSDEVSFRFNTIMPYVLIDDVMQQDFEMVYYKKIDESEFNTNIHKNVLMHDKKVYKKLFDEVNQLVIMNPYNETNIEFISKITYTQLEKRNHIREVLIDEMVKKIPFYENLKYLEPFQYDEARDVLIFLYMGKQLIVPLHEDLKRGLNIENLDFDNRIRKVFYHGVEICEQDFIFVNEKIYLKNPNTKNIDLIEAQPTIEINAPNKEKVIFFDMFEMRHCIILDNKQYMIENIYVTSSAEALNVTTGVIFTESKYGIVRYKSIDNTIIDIDISVTVLDGETAFNGAILYDRVDNKLIYRYSETETFTLTLKEVQKSKNYHRQTGMTAFSIFYAGNALPENSNKSFSGRENIFSSMTIPDDIYKIGRNQDNFDDNQHHKLLAEQLDLDISRASKHNMEHEPYIMFKSSTSSLKGLESYLKSNLKSISQDINVSPVYLVQRNRFISEWVRVSSVLPNSMYAKEALKDLVADLMETKLINGKYDDLMDIFKSNEYEKFSLDTNNIHDILVQYIRRYLEEEFMLEDFNYYLIHNVWMNNNRKRILDFIKNNATEEVIKQVSTMTYNSSFEKEKLFYIFVKELEKINKETIDVYKPIENYSDWTNIQENNHVHFEKPFRYDVIDISEFITMPIDWKFPLLMIRPLNDDGVFIKRDYRFIDLTIATNSQVTYDDAYNEYVEDIKFKLNRPVNYLDETLRILQELSLDNGYDFLGINLVIVRWIVERYLPNYILTNSVEDVETLRDVIREELQSAEHPNLVVSYNKIKESTLLTDLGTNVNEIYDTLIENEMILNSSITLEITDTEDLAYLDKIKKPVEHYFDFLFNMERYDLITRILALFTEDVIASSMLDLSFAINIKNSKGDETYDIYEKMIAELFDEFLPFHSVLDKIIFTIKIMETASSEAISKAADVEIIDTTLIDVFTKFTEQVRIQAIDRAIIAARINAIFPSNGLKICGGHDEIPYDFDRSIKPGGHDLMELGHDDYGVDDDWYILNKENWKVRPESIYTPPEFADLWWECIPENEFEKVVDTYISDYYHIKQNIFERDDRINSHFIDYIPNIDIGSSLNENPTIDVVEDYLIAIDTAFNIRFYDVDNIPMDLYGHDINSSPEDQTTLIGMKEVMYQTIMQDFYEKINIGILDSIWTDIKVVHDVIDGVPGHNEFGVDEYYHQRSPEMLGQDMSVMIYDELLMQGFEITAIDMTDVSLVDRNLAQIIASDISQKAMITVADTTHITISIWAGRERDSFITDNGTFIPGHDGFAYDEFYHNSADLDRIANMIDLTLSDSLGVIRVDFGFMRMLPVDPYQDLISQKFYRVDQPGSDVHDARVRDSFTTNIRIFGKDYLRVNIMDFYVLDIINEDLRREIYSQIENDTLDGDYVVAGIQESVVTRHIHHDFREHIIALEKYASVLDDISIIEIFGTRAANIERDELFELRIGDSFTASIKMKHLVERTMTRIDKDYLKSIKIEEENFVDFKYQDRDISVRFEENLRTYYSFNEKASIILTELNKYSIKQYNVEDAEVVLLDKLSYGDHHQFQIAGMNISTSDELLEVWTNRIYVDSMIIYAIDGDLATEILSDYEFNEMRTLQPHAEFGHMGYTEESIERSIDSRITDSLISISKDMIIDEVYTMTYDRMMHDVHEYTGELINVIISDSLNTYIDIVKKPWILPEFDEFGHDDQPHMYHGMSDEFDVSTQLRDIMKLDANTWLYNAGALVKLNDSIMLGEHLDISKETISVSMVDDLKVITLGFKDAIDITTTYNINLTKDFKDVPVSIQVQDYVWYGYKLREEATSVLADDRIAYGYEDMAMKDIVINAQITDWILTSYNFEDSLPVRIEDALTYTISEYIFQDSDHINVMIEDTLNIFETRNLIFKDDTSQATLSDKVFVSESTEIKDIHNQNDSFCVSITESLTYGTGKWFHETIRGYIQNRLSIYEEVNKGPDIDIELEDSFHEYTFISPFKDSLGISTYERLKYGLIFKDNVTANIIRDTPLIISRSWIVNRYGVDEVIHNDDFGQEYPDDISIDGSVTTQLFDSVKILTRNITFKDTLDIQLIDRLVTSDESGTDFDIKSKDGIIINSSDNLMYGIGGYYDYIWDAKEWDNFGYTLPYEDWTGQIPHDEIEHGALEHDQQGDDLSQITTGVSDNLLYGLDHFFKDAINIQAKDSGGFSTWGYQSSFRDTVSVWTENRLQLVYAKSNSKDLNIHIRKEQMGVSYEFEDTVKSHKYTSNGALSIEQININDLETNQLLEQIYKYRIYETIDAQVNENLLATALFKFDDEMSLVAEYNTKIELYKEQSDGSLTKSMTIIKDKSTSKVNLFLGDSINASMHDIIQGTYTDRPYEYLD